MRISFSFKSVENTIQYYYYFFFLCVRKRIILVIIFLNTNESCNKYYLFLRNKYKRVGSSQKLINIHRLTKFLSLFSHFILFNYKIIFLVIKGDIMSIHFRNVINSGHLHVHMCIRDYSYQTIWPESRPTRPSLGRGTHSHYIESARPYE